MTGPCPTPRAFPRPVERPRLVAPSSRTAELAQTHHRHDHRRSIPVAPESFWLSSNDTVEVARIARAPRATDRTDLPLFLSPRHFHHARTSRLIKLVRTVEAPRSQ